MPHCSRDEAATGSSYAPLALDYDCKCETIFALAQTGGEGEEEVEAAEGVEGAAAKEVEFQGCCSSWQLAMQRNNFAYCIEMQLRFQSQGIREEKKEEKKEAGLDLTMECRLNDL